MESTFDVASGQYETMVYFIVVVVMGVVCICGVRFNICNYIVGLF